MVIEGEMSGGAGMLATFLDYGPLRPARRRFSATDPATGCRCRRSLLGMAEEADHDDLTLREAIELHLRAMRAKRCARRSLETLEEETARHLADWLARPLASLRRHEIASRHEDLTAASGPYLANRVMQQLRAAGQFVSLAASASIV